MAVTATPYGTFLLGLGTGRFNFSSDTFKVMLTTSAYVPAADTDEFKSIVTHEISGTGYTAGGLTLSGVGWTLFTDYVSVPSVRMGVMAASPALWSSATFTGARIAVLYKSTGTDSTSPLIGWLDFGVDKSPSAEDFQVNFPSGAVRIKAG